MEIADSHCAEPVFQVTSILVLGVGHKHEQLSSVLEFRTHANTFIVGKTAVGDIHLCTELRDELFLQQVAGSLHRWIDHIEFDVRIGADLLRCPVHLTFENNELSVIERCQSAHTQGVLPFGAFHVRCVGHIPVLLAWLQLVIKTLEAQQIRDLPGDIGFLAICLQGVLRGRPKTMGSGIIGECLLTT